MRELTYTDFYVQILCIFVMLCSFLKKRISMSKKMDFHVLTKSCEFIAIECSEFCGAVGFKASGWV